MKNAFNECSRTAFLDSVSKDFPKISRLVYWCYSQPAELRFGHRCILGSTGVQQGHPLGPLLFSLVLLQFLDSPSVRDSYLLNLWYLDDGTFIGSRSSLLALLSCFAQSGPNFNNNYLACTSIYPNVNFFGLLEIVHFLTSLMQLNALILQTVAWSCWGLWLGDLLSFLNTTA